jgi:hypothetical protein
VSWLIAAPLLLTAIALGSAALLVATAPAFRMATGTRRREGWRFLACLGFAVTWTAGAVGSNIVQSYGITPGVNAPRLDYRWLTLGVLIFAAGGACCGMIARAAGPFPHAVKLGALAGALYPTLSLVPVITRTAWGATIGLWPLFILAWFGLPTAALYASALIQRRRLARYRRAACVACGYELAATKPQCTECGLPPQHLCHKCRHLVDRQPGEPCPRCKATIGARCWKCGYDLRGVDSGRCPECGVWKPVPAQRAEPAEPAPSTSSPS